MIFLFGDPFKVTTVGDHSWSNSLGSHPMTSITTESMNESDTSGLVIKSSDELESGNDNQKREDEFRCKMIAMVLHYLHLVASFWILSHSFYMYKRLWRYHDDCESLIIATYEDDSERYSNEYNCGNSIGVAVDPRSVMNNAIVSKNNEIDSNSSSTKTHDQLPKLPYNRGAGIMGLALFSWIVPMFCVIVSYYLNPSGYETRR